MCDIIKLRVKDLVPLREECKKEFVWSVVKEDRSENKLTSGGYDLLTFAVNNYDSHIIFLPSQYIPIHPQDFAPALPTDECRLATKSLDIITVSVGSAVSCGSFTMVWQAKYHWYNFELFLSSLQIKYSEKPFEFIL
jgi:hypothetical protein